MTCDLNPGEAQREALEAAAAMLGGAYPLARLRGGEHDDLAALAAFGAFTLALPESAGGAGMTILEEALVHTLFGRHLLSARTLAGALAIRLAQSSGAPGLAARASALAPRCSAAVVAGASILVDEPEGAALALLFDGRRLALLELAGARGEAVATMGRDARMLRLGTERPPVLAESREADLLGAADVLVSAQLLGIASATRDAALAHARTRRQFGRPIGAFQAIKHHCADMALRETMLSAQLDMAAIALRDGRADAPFQIAALRLLAPQAALANARIAIQIFGAIGFSAEADAHRFLKRAHFLGRLGAPRSMLEPDAPLAPLAPRRSSSAGEP